MINKTSSAIINFTYKDLWDLFIEVYDSYFYILNLENFFKFNSDFYKNNSLILTKILNNALECLILNICSLFEKRLDSISFYAYAIGHINTKNCKCIEEILVILEKEENKKILRKIKTYRNHIVAHKNGNGVKVSNIKKNGIDKDDIKKLLDESKKMIELIENIKDGKVNFYDMSGLNVQNKELLDNLFIRDK